MVSSDESLLKGIRSAIIKASNKTGVNLLDAWSAFPMNQTALAAMLSDGFIRKIQGINECLDTFIID